MNAQFVQSLVGEALWVAIQVAGPILIAAMIVGLAVSILQAVTSIQEQTLTVVPKIGALCLALFLLLPWILGLLSELATRCIVRIGNVQGF